MALTDFSVELRRRFMGSANGDPIRAIDMLLELMWECHKAETDGVPLPYGTWLLHGGPASLPGEIRGLREAYDTHTEQLDALLGGERL